MNLVFSRFLAFAELFLMRKFSGHTNDRWTVQEPVLLMNKSTCLSLKTIAQLWSAHIHIINVDNYNALPSWIPKSRELSNVSRCCNASSFAAMNSRGVYQVMTERTELTQNSRMKTRIINSPVSKSEHKTFANAFLIIVTLSRFQKSVHACMCQRIIPATNVSSERERCLNSSIEMSAEW
jgi:hypothetical protein